MARPSSFVVRPSSFVAFPFLALAVGNTDTAITWPLQDVDNVHAWLALAGWTVDALRLFLDMHETLRAGTSAGLSTGLGAFASHFWYAVENFGFSLRVNACRCKPGIANGTASRFSDFRLGSQFEIRNHDLVQPQCVCDTTFYRLNHDPEVLTHLDHLFTWRHEWQTTLERLEQAIGRDPIATA